MEEAILNIRDVIGERTSTVNRTGPGYSNATLERIFKRAEAIYYRKEISWDSSRFLTNGTLTGTGAELLDLPGTVNFSLMYGLFADSQRLIRYYEIPFILKGTGTTALALNNVFYFQKGQIGIIPNLSSGTVVYFDYYANYTPMSYSTDSDLHPYSVEAAILYTAEQAVKFRGDGNWKLIEGARISYESEMLPKIRRSSPDSTPLLPRSPTGKLFEILGTR